MSYAVYEFNTAQDGQFPGKARRNLEQFLNDRAAEGLRVVSMNKIGHHENNGRLPIFLITLEKTGFNYNVQVSIENLQQSVDHLCNILTHDVMEFMRNRL